MPQRAFYAITAVRWAGTQVAEAMMGLLDGTRRWALRPAPTRASEVVDRLVEGDDVISLFPDEAGELQPGPAVKVQVLPEGTEALALEDAPPGRGLGDLPRF